MRACDAVRAYLDQHGTGEPIKTMARKIRDLHPEFYPQNELGLTRARIALNDILRTGKYKQTHSKAPGHQGDRPKMPEPWPDDWTGPWEAPKGNALILSDVHIPHHEPKAIESALSWRTDWDYVVLLGDALNCQRLSQKFIPDKNAPTVRQEKQNLGLFLDMLAWYDKPIIYYAGNHEERYWKFMASRIPELADDPDLDFEKFFSLTERGVEMVSYGRTLKFGKLHGYHGHEVTANSPFTPQAPAAWLMRQTQVNAFCGHFHRSNEATSRRHDGSVIGCWTLGCLCTLTPKYARRNQWNHGFAFIEHDDSGNFEFHNKKILAGKVY